MMKRASLYTVFLTVFLMACTACVRAQSSSATVAPSTGQVTSVNLATYYSNANGKKKAELKTALYNIINNHTTISYNGLLDAYATSDRRADGKLRDWYSNVTNYEIGGSAEASSYKKEGDSYNREHSVPQSWFGKASPMRSDLVHVIPTDGYVNNRRGNMPFGENRGETYQSLNGYSKVGACTVSGFTGQCFEPNDEIKGDIARIYFYMVTCYENRISGWNGGTASQVFDGSTYPGLKEWTLKMMLRWSKQDPVDEVERARNEAVYQLQQNRNPFVDYPSLCEYVWGDSISYAFDVTKGHEVNPVTPDDPDDPDKPDNPDNPNNPDVTSGSIDLTQLTWTATLDATYGSGFTAKANGLTISYYKASSSVEPIMVTTELRFYDQSVLVISGATINKLVFYDAGGSKSGSSIMVNGSSYAFEDGKITWTGSMNPFICQANKQLRFKSIDVTIEQSEPTLPEPYVRGNLEPGAWGTICLPYNAVVEGALLYSLMGVDNEQQPTSLLLDEENGLDAGIPYFFIATENQLKATFTSADVVQPVNRYGFIGSYEATTVPPGYYVLSDNALVKTSENSSIGAHCAYLDLDQLSQYNGEADMKLSIEMEDGIARVASNRMQAADVFDLTGRRVNPSQRGVYIVNGKKIALR